MSSTELKLLQNWHIKLALLAAIVLPTIAVTSAFSDVKETILRKDAAVHQRVSEVELKVEQNFADKKTVKQIHTELQQLQINMVEIKTLLKSR